MRPFRPLLSNAHWQTVAGHFWPRRLDTARWPVEDRLFRTEPEVQVLMRTQRPGGNSRGEIVMVHGLESSGEAGHLRTLSQLGLAAGYSVHRFHMRTCGGTEHLCSTLYHAGLTSDLLEVLRRMRAGGAGPLHLVGFSLGGNVVLKLAGELGAAAADLLAGVAAVSAPIDLAACSGRMSQSENRLYQRRFVRRMRRRLCATGRFTPADFAGLDSVRDIDDRITAPSFGFGNANNYYRTQSALRYLEKIRLPTLLIQAQDDPLIPFDTFRDPVFQRNRNLRLVAPKHGGHLGFVAWNKPYLWVEAALMEWVESLGAERPGR